MLATLTTLLAQVQIREAGSGATTCQGKNEAFCPSYVIDNIDDYVSPVLEHLVLVLASVLAGFLVAMVLAVLSHGRRWLIPVFIGTTGVLYTIPSIALFLLLLPITGRGTETAIIALSLYNLQIIYRNANSGLANIPRSALDSGTGMGMTKRQLLWKVELPLALPEIIAGVRIATVSTVAIATLAIFAGAGGLGEILYNEGVQRGVFKTNIVFGSLLAVSLAIAFDGLLILVQRFAAPWRRARAL
ncbi:MAG: ABC transporter permease [Solirubrobacterales bacterium]|nr:ABC transporter permease [Solirubrobacterales bacterium]